MLISKCLWISNEVAKNITKSCSLLNATVSLSSMTSLSKMERRILNFDWFPEGSEWFFVLGISLFCNFQTVAFAVFVVPLQDKL